MSNAELQVFYFATCNIVLGLLGCFVPSVMRKDEKLSQNYLVKFVGCWLLVQMAGGAVFLFIFRVPFTAISPGSFPFSLGGGRVLLYMLTEGYLGWLFYHKEFVVINLKDEVPFFTKVWVRWAVWGIFMLGIGGILAVILLLQQPEGGWR